MITGAWEDIRDKLDFARAGKPMLVGMAVVLVMVAAVSAYVLAGAATPSEFKLEPSGQQEPVGQDESQGLFVHVSGAVREPGLYELQHGARVADAVQAAGGFADEADPASCNLARKVEDGEQITVGCKAPDGAVQPAQDSSGIMPGKVNLNTASAEQLQELPGIGSATAQKIVADRTANGPFRSVEDLTRVSGVGDKKLAALVDLVCV